MLQDSPPRLFCASSIMPADAVTGSQHSIPLHFSPAVFSSSLSFHSSPLLPVPHNARSSSSPFTLLFLLPHHSHYSTHLFLAPKTAFLLLLPHTVLRPSRYFQLQKEARSLGSHEGGRDECATGVCHQCHQRVPQTSPASAMAGANHSTCPATQFASLLLLFCLQHVLK